MTVYTLSCSLSLRGVFGVHVLVCHRLNWWHPARSLTKKYGGTWECPVHSLVRCSAVLDSQSRSLGGLSVFLLHSPVLFYEEPIQKRQNEATNLYLPTLSYPLAWQSSICFFSQMIDKLSFLEWGCSVLPQWLPWLQCLPEWIMHSSFCMACLVPWFKSFNV